MRYENAIKFTAIWLESFILFSVIWTFYPILSEVGRKNLDQRISAKYEACRTDFTIYQKEKKRKAAEKAKEKAMALKSQQEKAVKGKGGSSSRRSTVAEKETPQTTPTPAVKKEVVTFSPTWSDDLDEKPMLVSDFPEKASFFDYYFNLESSNWSKFSLEMAMNDAQIVYSSQLPSQRKL